MSLESAPVQHALVDALDRSFAPAHLEVVNESGMHNVPPGSETHFKVVIVSEQFDGRALVHRHRAVHKAVAEQLAGPVHALSVHAYTVDQWQALLGAQAASPESPPCLGGSKN